METYKKEIGSIQALVDYLDELCNVCWNDMFVLSTSDERKEVVVAARKFLTVMEDYQSWRERI